MAVINKGISKAVKEAFINGTHEPEAMLVKLAHLNTDEYRKHYLVNLTKDLREKYGMDVVRNNNYGRRKKKTNSKPTHKQLVANIKNAVHPNGERSPVQLDIFQNNVMAEKPSQVDMTNLQRLLERNASMGEGKSEIYKRPISLEIADAISKHDMSGIVEVKKKVYVGYSDYEKMQAIEADRDYLTAEFIKLDDAYKTLQTAYDDMADNNSELKREIARLQVIITYLEGKK